MEQTTITIILMTLISLCVCFCLWAISPYGFIKLIDKEEERLKEISQTLRRIEKKIIKGKEK